MRKLLKLTRRHGFRLVREPSRCDVRKYSYSRSNIREWNKNLLPVLVTMLNNKIDKYLTRTIIIIMAGIAVFFTWLATS